MDETLDAIRHRFSCRQFNPAAMPLQAIALAGVQAPSGLNQETE